MMVRSIAIAGLGLIGGSIARDCAARGLRVLAWDRDEDVVRAAMDEQVVHTRLDASFEGLDQADMFLIATPVSAAAGVLAAAVPRLASHAIVTDAGSTKRSIEQSALHIGIGERFVGAHPFAGDVRSGWSASRVGLFRDATVYLCPTVRTIPDALETARDFWGHIGTRIEIIDAALHDELLAVTSHLPQVTATALARVLLQADIPLSRLGPGGRDMTRLAKSSADVWTPIALDNADRLLVAVRRLEHELGALRDAIERRNEAAIHGFFTSAQTV